MTIVTLNREYIKYAQWLSWVRSKYAHSNWQEDDYKRGKDNTRKDPAAVERRGALGEVAAREWIGEGAFQLDENMYENGDQGIDSILPDGKILDVKLHVIPAYSSIKETGKYGPFYISATDWKGEIKVQKPDIFLFASVFKAWQGENELDVMYHVKQLRMDRYQEERYEGFNEDVQKLQGRVIKGTPFLYNGVDLHGVVTRMEIEIHGYILKPDLLAIADKRLAPLIKNNGPTDPRRNYYIKEEELKSPDRFLENIRKLLAHV